MTVVASSNRSHSHENSVLVLIDHQPYQLAKINSHDPQTVVNDSIVLHDSKSVRPSDHLPA